MARSITTAFKNAIKSSVVRPLLAVELEFSTGTLRFWNGYGDLTMTAGGSSNDARFAFNVDETFILNILDGGLRIKSSGFLEFGSGNEIISDSSGTTTLKNIDALDATTE